MTPDVIAHWAGFYTLAAGASATLIGLLFVAVSLHADIFVNSGRNEARTTADQTLSTFTYVVIIGLIFNAPQVDGPSIGLSLLALGAVGLVRTGSFIYDHYRREWRGNPKRPVLDRTYRSFVVRRMVYPLFSYLALLVAAVDVFRGDSDALYLIMAITFYLITTGLANSWNLMVNLSRLQFHRTSAANPTGSDQDSNSPPP